MKKTLEQKYDLAELRQWYDEKKDKVEELLQLIKDIRKENKRLTELRKTKPIVVIQTNQGGIDTFYQGDVDVIHRHDVGDKEVEWDAFHARSMMEGKELDAYIKQVMSEIE